MAEIISIATAVPRYCHRQADIFQFMQKSYQLSDEDTRRLKFLYDHSGINTRYSVVPDYGNLVTEENTRFIPVGEPAVFPSLEKRMEIYHRESVILSADAIRQCIQGRISPGQITHLITVSCTGMSAPGLDLQLLQELSLSPDIFRTSVNFMGCYAAIHALKLAKMICDSTVNANVVIVATELCTLHFQQAFTPDNAASSLLFSDGSAAVFVSNCLVSDNSLSIRGFYSHVTSKGEKDMAWELSSHGFLMTLSGYVPQLIQEDINQLVEKAVSANGIQLSEITKWCIHPGGKRILDLIQKQLSLSDKDLYDSREILYQYGNMSSPTVLFVLKKILDQTDTIHDKILGMAFGPGLTMETFIAER